MNAERKALFEVMRTQMEVMSEHGDNETSLFNEILTADTEIIEAYKSLYLS